MKHLKNINISKSLTSMSLMFLTFSCGEHNTDYKPKFSTGALQKRGHEDITRFGVMSANDLIREKLSVDGFYPVPASGVAGANTGNKIVRGNFETDFPERGMMEFYNKRVGMPVEQWEDWHESPILQHLHGLRNFSNSMLANNFDTCLDTSYAIRRALKTALPHLKENHGSKQGLFWLGHGTHTIQDTFSKAHSVRVGPNLKTIKDHCTYSQKFPGICFHKDGDERDTIWKQNGGRCEWDPNHRKRSCLKNEAKEAANATAGFLYLAAYLRANPNRDIDGIITNWFHGDSSLPNSGYFDCRSLKKDSTSLYGIESDSLYRVNSRTGNYDLIGGKTDWALNPTAMTRLNGDLYIIENKTLFQVNTKTGKFVPLGKKDAWSKGSISMTSIDHYLYILENGSLHRVNPNNGKYSFVGERRIWDKGPVAMTSLDGRLYVIAGKSLYKVNPSNGDKKVLGNTGAWGNGPIALTSLNGELYGIESGELFHINPKDGKYVQKGESDSWKNGPIRMTSLETRGGIYIVENGSLWEVDPFNGLFRMLGKKDAWSKKPLLF